MTRLTKSFKRRQNTKDALFTDDGDAPIVIDVYRVIRGGTSNTVVDTHESIEDVLNDNAAAK